ncbi:MAG TPA: NAD(P)-dependent alcohol dehydrogenase [Bacillales bacterium]|nr:NAD(P)-dependent alcohol dehydrogenase [Bacillales bacterium]
MPEQMNAAVLDQPLSIGVKRVEKPVPDDNEALVKVHCIGICGSDVHYYEHGKIGRYEVKEPIILGHELAGDVVAVGKDVTHIVPGDRVAVEPGMTCGTCKYCRAGRYNLCPDVEFMATPPVDGAWADYVTVRSDFLHKLPDPMSYEEGALLEPFSVGYHAMKRGSVGPGDSVMIQGLGPVGLLAVQAAKLFGASKIYVSDVVDFRIQKALDFGVDGVVRPADGDVRRQLQEISDGRGVDKIIETSGNHIAVADTVHLVNRGGTIVYVGLPVKEEIPMDIAALVDAELDVFGVFRYVNTYPSAIEGLAQSGLDLKGIITDSYPLSDIETAVEKARKEKDKSIKIMIYPDGSGLE